MNITEAHENDARKQVKLLLFGSRGYSTRELFDAECSLQGVAGNTLGSNHPPYLFIIIIQDFGANFHDELEKIVQVSSSSHVGTSRKVDTELNLLAFWEQRSSLLSMVFNDLLQLCLDLLDEFLIRTVNMGLVNTIFHVACESWPSKSMGFTLHCHLVAVLHGRKYNFSWRRDFVGCKPLAIVLSSSIGGSFGCHDE
jgi:hypothetical protein